ncbi:hypothetical protein HKX48_004919 [Thoreauomyces humboldtii]|nr:hypothetical protein HKX48_004919 [Thoreauomyces humboldtii]
MAASLGMLESPGRMNDSPTETMARESPAKRRHLSWSEGGEREDRPDGGKFLSIPRRLDSKDPLNAKRYAELTPADLAALSVAALKRINALFKHYKIRILPPDVLKSIANDTSGLARGKRFMWWKPWGTKSSAAAKGADPARSRDPDQAPPASILALHLVRGLDFASAKRDLQPSGIAEVDHMRIPVVISECLQFLKRNNGLAATGLFRVNGSERRMAQLAVLFDTAPDYGRGVDLEGYTAYDVAGFIKRYLRIIPEPLLTKELYPHFLRCLDVPAEGGTRIRALRLLLMLLPPAHLVLLETVLDLMREIVALASINQMTSHALARIISPNILKPRESATKKQGLEEYERGSYVMEYLIDHAPHFCVTNWHVCPFQLLDLGYASAGDVAGRPVMVTVEQQGSVFSGTPNSSTHDVAGTQELVELASEHHQNVLAPQLPYTISVPPSESPVPTPAPLAPESDSQTRLRRVRTAPTKRNREPPRGDGSSSSGNEDGSTEGTRRQAGEGSGSGSLPYTGSSQSLQSLNHYQQQSLRRQASQVRFSPSPERDRGLDPQPTSAPPASPASQPHPHHHQHHRHHHHALGATRQASFSSSPQIAEQTREHEPLIGPLKSTLSRKSRIQSASASAIHASQA